MCVWVRVRVVQVNHWRCNWERIAQGRIRPSVRPLISIENCIFVFEATHNLYFNRSQVVYIYTYIYIEQHVIKNRANFHPLTRFISRVSVSLSTRVSSFGSIHRFNDFPFYFSLVHLSMEERKWKCERSQGVFSFSSFFLTTTIATCVKLNRDISRSTIDDIYIYIYYRSWHRAIIGGRSKMRRAMTIFLQRKN